MQANAKKPAISGLVRREFLKRTALAGAAAGPFPA